MIYHSQAYADVDALAASVACLQADASVALPAGFAAASFQPLRACSKDCFIGPSTAGALAAILVRQASYFLMYSSHSGTPIESPAATSAFLSSAFGAVVVVAGAVVAGLSAGFALALFAVLAAGEPQAAAKIAKQNRLVTAKKFFMLIYFLLVFCDVPTLQLNIRGSGSCPEAVLDQKINFDEIMIMRTAVRTQPSTL